ncbi:Fe-S cluster assembly protein SufB [Thermotomaculum hydrothermale]|uniref:Fe-S cluster assembly protein SufB n=1 Tax=Thermotomaculum hydrothermale TaxID=981385 RepID=A0A7R6PP54_9BACT|nr:Fe-S cluster assembly protein SufB [Thermotomaculum hydrothermale]BBB33637.1 Fe-S cluster assembly protein SufB [Thermotomaculum hydrothermale]
MNKNKDIKSISEEYKYGFKTKENYKFKSDKGLTEEIVRAISEFKKEPEWMLEFRLKAYNAFKKMPMPWWGNTELLNTVQFDNIHYYIKPEKDHEKSWDDVPDEIKETFDKLGIPEVERKFLAGVTAQYESEVVYHSIKKEFEKLGIVFLDMDSAVKEYPELVKKYFGTVIPIHDNKFAALNSAVWSGGSFIYVPKGVKVETPLQAYFRINAQNMGQFERTLIIADEDSDVHYIEGCSAPVYSSDSLHAAVVEVIALKGARIRYSTIQNWSNNVYNLVTKRAVAYENATVEWVDGNIGAKFTMKYPAIFLKGEGAHAEVLSVALAGDGQHQDSGAKAFHLAPNTTSRIVSKSISTGTGRASYRGWVKVNKGMKNCKSDVRCDALIFGDKARSDTYPRMEVYEPTTKLTHEATVSKIQEDQLFYLMSRGLSEDEASTMIINGFFEPFTKELPMEYAVEFNRLVSLEMEGSIG